MDNTSPPPAGSMRPEQQPPQRDPVTESDLDPAAFLKSVRELSEKRDREDQERFRKLEEEVQKGREERAARRLGELCDAARFELGLSATVTVTVCRGCYVDRRARAVLCCYTKATLTLRQRAQGLTICEPRQNEPAPSRRRKNNKHNTRRRPPLPARCHAPPPMPACSARRQ